jgi:ERCC4-type nuclease
LTLLSQIRLLIDFREKFRDSIQNIRNFIPDFTVEIRNLPIGDFGWAIETENGKFQVECLVERKKLMDLLETLNDRRAYDQPDRLTAKGKR